MSVRGHTQTVFHPGTGTVIPLADCLILLVPDAIDADDVEEWCQSKVNELEGEFIPTSEQS